MEHPQHIQPSTYPSHHIPLDDPSGSSRTRQPLSDSAGNARPHGLDYHDSKSSQPRLERPMYSIPTLPSQPAPQTIGNTLELRRHSQRKRRQHKLSVNPIVNSPQYIAYRQRQTRDGNPKDQKWPEVLEDAFLDALVELPVMHRRKFSFEGKPHGRNELITEYLWIYYCESLPPGAYRDPTMRRTRKQVSSHIQVLKGFMRDHPAYWDLFPPNKGPKNGFEDSFKDDPCLIALSQGRLPTRRYTRLQQVTESVPPVKPATFWLILKPERPHPGSDHSESQDEGLCNEDQILHQFTQLRPHSRSRGNLEAIDCWRQRFPLLQELQVSGTLYCEVIHMDVALHLLSALPPRSTQLLSRTMLSIPGREQRNYNWRVVTTLNKPPELCSDSCQDGRLKDPPIDRTAFPVEVSSVTDSATLINVPFPAAQFAYVFSCLVSLQRQYEDQLRDQSLGRSTSSHVRPAREYLDQISMFQELQSATGHQNHIPFISRAIFIWTFHEAKEGEPNNTTWRYLDHTPPRRMCMSPSPHPIHQVSAAMNDNFNNWAEVPMHLQHPSMMDPYGQGLATPPNTAGLQSPFGGNGFPFSQQRFDLPGDNLSFISSTTLDSESTLVEDTAANIENFLSSAHNVNLADFDTHDANNWQLPTSESFDADPAWAYGVPSNTPAINWGPETKNQVWSDIADSKQLEWPQQQSQKNHEEWPQDQKLENYEHWQNMESSPAKQHINYVEQNLEQKLIMMQDYRDTSEAFQESQNSFVEAQVSQLSDVNMDIQLNGNREVTNGIMDGHVKEPDWHNADDEFDYAQLAERLKV